MVTCCHYHYYGMIMRGHADFDGSLYFLINSRGLTGISTVSLPLTWQARAQNAELEILRQQQERDLAEAGLRNIHFNQQKIGDLTRSKIEKWVYYGLQHHGIPQIAAFARNMRLQTCEFRVFHGFHIFRQKQLHSLDRLTFNADISRWLWVDSLCAVIMTMCFCCSQRKDRNLAIFGPFLSISIFYSYFDFCFYFYSNKERASSRRMRDEKSVVETFLTSRSGYLHWSYGIASCSCGNHIATSRHFQR